MCSWRQLCCSLRCPFFLSTLCLMCLLAILFEFTSLSDLFQRAHNKMGDKIIGDLSRWMENLPNEVTKSTQLYRLVIPGSHDSATFDLDTQGGKADDFSSYLQISNDKLEKWFKTQHLDFSEQLKFGIRYMDLRIIKYGSGDVRFVHGLFSRKPVGFYLSGIRTFLEENPKEIVILDFNHVYEMQKNDHMVLCVEMNDIFKGMMVSKQKCEEKGLNPYRMTLQELWDIDGRVLILYKNARYCRQLDTIWSRDDIDILWPYTTDEDSVVTNLMDHYAGLYRKDALVVWQGILTPHADDDYAARMDRYKDLHEYVTPTTNTIASWVKQKPHISINIICADFVEEHEFVKTVVMANVM